MNLKTVNFVTRTAAARNFKNHKQGKVMSQAIEIYSKIQDPFTAAMQIGEHFARSGMFGVDRKEAGTILALACITGNQTPFEILRTYDIVMGKLRKKALACYAEFRQRGGRVKWLNTGDDGKEAVGEFTFEGNTLTVKFTIDDAIKQGLVKNDSAWKKTPGNMLRARVLSNAIGMLCPEIVAGVVDGEDSEAPTAEPKAILTKQEPATPVEKKATVVEVATVEILETGGLKKETAEKLVNQISKTETRETRATPEPPHTSPTAEPVASAPTPTAERFIAKANAQTGKLTPETVEAISNLIGQENEGLAMKWLEKKEWIKPMGAIGELSVARAQKIFDKPDAFLKAISEGK